MEDLITWAVNQSVAVVFAVGIYLLIEKMIQRMEDRMDKMMEKILELINSRDDQK